MIRFMAATLCVCLLATTGLAVAKTSSHDERTVSETDVRIPVSAGGPRTGGRPNSPDQARTLSPVSLTVSPRTGLYRGLSAATWAGRYRERTRQVQKLRRVLFSRPSVTEAIELAGATYGNTATLWRKARCESGFDPNARNGSEASGLFQFLPSTWASTPYGRFSIFSPYANALAAAWMHSAGRGGEWVCR